MGTPTKKPRGTKEQQNTEDKPEEKKDAISSF